MPLFKKKEDKDKPTNDKKESRRDFRLAKIQEVTAKAYAIANKRKWLFFIIASAIVAYLLISSGGLGGGGILEKVKGFF
jgi:hypothetical protein